MSIHPALPRIQILVSLAALLALLCLSPAALAGILKWAELPHDATDPFIDSVDCNSLKQGPDGWIYFLVKEVPNPKGNPPVMNPPLHDGHAAFYIEYAAMDPYKPQLRPIEVHSYDARSQLRHSFKYPDNTVRDASQNKLYQMVADFSQIYLVAILNPKAKAHLDQYAYVSQTQVYQMLMRRRIQRNWHPQPGDQEVKIMLFTNEASRMIHPHVTESSLSQAEDDRALKAVENATPFPLYPSRWPHSTLKIELTFQEKAVSITGHFWPYHD